MVLPLRPGERGEVGPLRRHQDFNFSFRPSANTRRSSRFFRPSPPLVPYLDFLIQMPVQHCSCDVLYLCWSPTLLYTCRTDKMPQYTSTLFFRFKGKKIPSSSIDSCASVYRLKLVLDDTHCVKQSSSCKDTPGKPQALVTSFFPLDCVIVCRQWSNISHPVVTESGKHRRPTASVVISSAPNDRNLCSCFLRRCDLAAGARSCGLTCQARL